MANVIEYTSINVDPPNVNPLVYIVTYTYGMEFVYVCYSTKINRAYLV